MIYDNKELENFIERANKEQIAEKTLRTIVSLEYSIRKFDENITRLNKEIYGNGIAGIKDSVKELQYHTKICENEKKKELEHSKQKKVDLKWLAIIGLAIIELWHRIHK